MRPWYNPGLHARLRPDLRVGLRMNRQTAARRLLPLATLILATTVAGCGNGQFSGKVTIAKPANVVFSWITQSEKRRQWDTSIVKETSLNNLPPGVGARNLEVIDMDGHQMELAAEVTEYEPGRRLRLHLVGSGMDLRAGYDLTEAAGVTTVDYQGDFQVTNWFMKPMATMIQDGSVKKMNADLARLKSVVEAQPL